MNSSNPPHYPVHACRLWFAALMLAGCETWIDFGARPGLNWLLSALLMSIAFAAFLRAAGKRASWQRMAPVMFACVLAGGAAITASPVLDALVLLGALAALAVGLRLRAGTITPERLGAVELVLSPATAGIQVLREAGVRMGDGARELRAESSVPTLRGVAMAAPITLGLALLLSNADPVMAYWRDSTLRALQELTFLGRTIFFAIACTVLLGSFGLALRPAISPDPSPRHPGRTGFRLGTTERAIILTAVVALFGLFIALQISHLFGNAAELPGTGLSYAQATHQGFAELTIAASLCVVLVITLTGSAGATGLCRREQILSVALIVESQLLLLSAYRRIAAYEDAYGYTELRLFVQFYEGCVLIALALLALQVLRRPDFRRFARHCAVTACVALSALLYWNHAAWIARANLARYQRTGVLDLPYLANSLGPDAVPELLRSLPALPPATQDRLRSCLRARYTPKNVDRLGAYAWYEWSYRREELKSALALDGLVAGGSSPQMPDTTSTATCAATPAPAAAPQPVPGPRAY
jgi:hypothetical protein